MFLFFFLTHPVLKDVPKDDFKDVLKYVLDVVHEVALDVVLVDHVVVLWSINDDLRMLIWNV